MNFTLVIPDSQQTESRLSVRARYSYYSGSRIVEKGNIELQSPLSATIKIAVKMAGVPHLLCNDIREAL